MSQIRNWSSKLCPSKRDAEHAADLVAVRAGAGDRVVRPQHGRPGGGRAGHGDPVGVLFQPGRPGAPSARSISGWAAMHSSRISSVRDWEMLTNGGNAGLPALGEGEAEQFGVAVERARRGPGDALAGDPPPGADRVPDVEHVALLARSTWNRPRPGAGAGRAGPPAGPSGPASAPRSAPPARCPGPPPAAPFLSPATRPRPRGRARRSRSAAARSRTARPTAGRR